MNYVPKGQPSLFFWHRIVCWHDKNFALFEKFKDWKRESMNKFNEKNLWRFSLLIFTTCGLDVYKLADSFAVEFLNFTADFLNDKIVNLSFTAAFISSTAEYISFRPFFQFYSWNFLVFSHFLISATDFLNLIFELIFSVFSNFHTNLLCRGHFQNFCVCSVYGLCANLRMQF